MELFSETSLANFWFSDLVVQPLKIQTQINSNLCCYRKRWTLHCFLHEITFCIRIWIRAMEEHLWLLLLPPDCSGVIFYHGLSWLLSFLAVLVFFSPILGLRVFSRQKSICREEASSGLSAEVLWKEWLLPGKVFFCFTCYPDAAQTLALAQDHSMDIPSQDRLKVKSPCGDFFSCTEWPLLCTCGSWAPKAFSWMW